MRSCKPLVVLGPNVAHVLLAIAPDGNGVVRNNVNPAEQRHGRGAGGDRRRIGARAA